MRPVHVLLSTLFVTTALTGSALAAAKITDSWKTGVMRDPKGNFAYCVSEARFENDLWVVIALNTTGEVNIGIGQKGAQLPVGGARNSTVQIDGSAVQTLPARVAKPELYVINGGRSGNLLQQIAGGKNLTVDGNSFTLTGSSKAMNTLKECVGVQGAPPAQQAPVMQNAAAGSKSLPDQWSGGSPAAPAQQQAQVAVAPAPQFDANGQPKVVFEDNGNPLAAVPGETVLATTQNQKPEELAAAPAVASVVPAPVVPAPAEVAVAAAPAGSLEDSTARVMAALEGESATAQSATSSWLNAEHNDAIETQVAPAPVSAAAPATAPMAEVAAETAAAPVDVSAVVSASVPVPAETAPVEAVPDYAEVANTEAPAAGNIPAPVAQAAGLPAPLSTLLRQAGLNSIVATAPKQGDAYAWQGDGLTGVVHEELVKPGSNLKELTAARIGVLKAFCEGEFSDRQGAQKLEGDVQVQTLQTRCRSAKANIYSTWVFSLTKSGVFSSIEHVDATGQREAADKVQNGLLAALTGKQG